MLHTKIPKNHFLYLGWLKALILIGVVISIGICGYFFIYDYSFVDAIYMTIITVGTVGFGEVAPLDDSGKIFTSSLILLSIFVFGYAVTTISATLVSINSFSYFKSKKMQNKIDSLEGHIILCGYGKTGVQAANRLKSSQQSFVIIENNNAILDHLDAESTLFVDGNAIEDEILLKAGILNASHLMTTLPSDADNVFITLTARQLNPKIKIISRASDESSIKKLKIAGAQNIIMPDKIGGDHMASLIVAPDLIEFLDNLSSPTSGKMNVQEIVLSNQLHISTIDELKIRDKTGCTVIGYKTASGEYIVNPAPSHKVETKGRIIVLGNDLQIEQLNTVFKIR